MADDSNITLKGSRAGTSSVPSKPLPSTRRPLSYAQNMEDYHLHVAFAGARHGRYVDIGGGHPVAGSVSATAAAVTAAWRLLETHNASDPDIAYSVEIWLGGGFDPQQLEQPIAR